MNIATGETWHYGYDAKDELVSAEDDGPGGSALLLVDYTYDVFGNRLEKDVTVVGPNATATTRYAYDGWNPAKAGSTGTSAYDVWATFDGSGSLTTRYVDGDAVDQVFARVDASGTEWLFTDHLGSVRAVTDGSGTLLANVGYDAFGNVTSFYGPTPGALGMYQWTGQVFDNESGLYQMRAREYDPTTGRWISQDPMGFDAGDSNLYRYANNRPTEGTDPSGLDEIQRTPPLLRDNQECMRCHPQKKDGFSIPFGKDWDSALVPRHPNAPETESTGNVEYIPFAYVDVDGPAIQKRIETLAKAIRDYREEFAKLQQSPEWRLIYSAEGQRLATEALQEEYGLIPPRPVRFRQAMEARAAEENAQKWAKYDQDMRRIEQDKREEHNLVRTKDVEAWRAADQSRVQEQAYQLQLNQLGHTPESLARDKAEAQVFGFLADLIPGVAAGKMAIESIRNGDYFGAILAIGIGVIEVGSVVKMSSAAKGVAAATDARIVGHVVPGSTDLGNIALRHRQLLGISPERNIAVFELTFNNGSQRNIVRASRRAPWFASDLGHGERRVHRYLENIGIDPSKVTRVYTDLPPCVAPRNISCLRMLQRTYPNAAVTYGFRDAEEMRRFLTTLPK